MTIETAAVGKVLVDVAPTALGAFISMQYVAPNLSRWQKMSALISAWAIGTYAGRAVIAYLDVKNERIADAIMLGVALFGMSFVSTLMSEIKPIVKGLLNRYLGGQK